MTMGAREADRIAGWARCLRVGVTGHRLARLEGVDLPSLAEGVRAVMAAIDGTLRDAPSLHLVSSLAEGADSIAADAALGQGWRLDVVLPLPQADYAGDFARGAQRDAHLARVTAAHALFELPVASVGNGDRTAAYERAGRIVLSQSDIVIAIWDGQPARGRGGAAQIIAEAVLRGIPVIHIDPATPAVPMLLWDGLSEHDFGQQSVETVSRSGIDRLPDVIDHLIRRAPDRVGDALLAEIERPTRRRRRRFAIAYPLLLTVMGVGGTSKPTGEEPLGEVAQPEASDAVNQHRLALWFARADANAVAAAQTFRSAYVTNFTLAAFAVIVSLLGLAMPYAVKPVLAVIELVAIGTILAVTSLGRRANWHRRWLDQRHLAERLRCLLIARRMGELGLRRGRTIEANWVTWAMHAVGRMTGLPNARIDDAYLADVLGDLIGLIDRQIDYLDSDAARMHRLDHRLHRLGSWLFGATAAVCVAVVAAKLVGGVVLIDVNGDAMHRFSIGAIIASAALPACGAAIYGIRMQSDFAGIAERSATLAVRLRALRLLIEQDPLRFDLLSQRIRRTTDLLTEDLSNWLHIYRARPLALPG